MKKRLVALTLTCALAATALAGCGGSTGGDSTASGDSTAATETSTAATETSTAEGSVYYLNFKPEQDQQWQDLAKAYTEETGVPVTVSQIHLQILHRSDRYQRVLPHQEWS